MKKLQLFMFGALVIANASVFLNTSFAQEPIKNSVQTEENNCHSFAWNLAAAQKGDAQAQYDLGMMYLNGDDVKVDNKQAINWLKVSSQQNKCRSSLSFSRNV